MDSSWKNLQIRIEAAWNMRTTPKTNAQKRCIWQRKMILTTLLSKPLTLPLRFSA